MELRIGDKVKFLNDTGGGIVVNIIDNEKALVQIEDGFEIPVLISQLIKDLLSGAKQDETFHQSTISLNSQTKYMQEKKESPVFKKDALLVNSKFRSFFAFIPAGTDSSKFEMFLINDSDYNIYSIIAIEKDEKLKVIEKGELEPDMKLNVGSFDYNEMLAFDAILIEILVFSDMEFKLQLPVHYRINLKSLNLLLDKNFVETEYFDDFAFIIDLLAKENNENEKLLVEKVKESEIKDNSILIKKEQTKNNDIFEVDLHVDKLVENDKALSNSEILNIQMATFKTALENAIAKKVKKIVFIHGVGNGILRYELRKTLDLKYPDLQHQDASFAEYGYGATMVILKKN